MIHKAGRVGKERAMVPLFTWLGLQILRLSRIPLKGSIIYIYTNRQYVYRYAYISRSSNVKKTWEIGPSQLVQTLHPLGRTKPLHNLVDDHALSTWNFCSTSYAFDMDDPC